MPFSRTKKFKQGKNSSVFIRTNLFSLKHPFKKWLLIGSIGVALATTNSIVYAGSGISPMLKNWYMEKLQLEEEQLELSVLTETNNQKALLLKRVTEQTKASINELQNYAADQERIINQKVQEKMEEVSKGFESNTQLEMEGQKKLIDEQLQGTLKNSNIVKIDQEEENPGGITSKEKQDEKDKTPPVK